jgi:hypothetical protein
LFYTFEISGGKEGLTSNCLVLRQSVPIRVARQAVKAEEKKERKEKVIRRHRREVVLVKEKSLFDFWMPRPFLTCHTVPENGASLVITILSIYEYSALTVAWGQKSIHGIYENN